MIRYKNSLSTLSATSKYRTPTAWPFFFFFFFFATNSSSSLSLKRIGEDSVMQIASEDSQTTYESDRALLWQSTDHYVITTNSVQKIEAYIPFIIYMSTLILCVFYMYHSNLQSLTPSKYFATVDLQTIFRKQFVRYIHNRSVYVTVSLSTAWVIDSRVPTNWNHSVSIS